jgi:hypothetical protein
LPPGSLSICAFTDRFECDALVRPAAPAFDGRPHSVVVRTNRLLLTARGWVDCVRVQCAIALHRNTNVSTIGGGVSSGVQMIALAPYRLPTTAAPMPRPKLTIAAHPPAHVGDSLTVTLHDPPPYVDPARRLIVGQCASNDLRRINDCRVRFVGNGQTQAWTKLADGSLRQRWEVIDCNNAAGCYLAVQPPAKGFPPVARTPRFTVSP